MVDNVVVEQQAYGLSDDVISVIKKHLANNSLQKIKKRSSKKIVSLSKEVSTVLSTLAYSGAKNQEQANDAFNCALCEIGFKKSEMRRVKDCTMLESLPHVCAHKSECKGEP